MKIRVIAIVTATILTISCQRNLNVDFSTDDPVLNTPFSVVQLAGDSSLVYLTDYFPDPSVIDSVSIPNVFNYTLSTDKRFLILKADNQSLPFLTTFSVWAKGTQFTLVVRKNRKIPVTFTYEPKDQKVNKVQLAGQINDWNPSATNLTYDGQRYTTTLLLNPGKYHYQVVIDGKW
ncbi:MAG TPA: hypothetical protein DDY04_00405, partial [Bacteroidales bacterium]|nr:hypothetical protein [Bacteroidales bacterium]